MMAPEGSSPAEIPAGWYPDPNGRGERYWDGGRWTEQLRDTAPPGPPVQQAAPVQQPAQLPAQQPVPQVAQTPYPAAPGPAAPGAFGGPGYDVYSQAVEPNQVLTPEQRQAYSQHTLTSFPAWLAVVLHILTLGIFSVFFFLSKHNSFPRVKPDDPSAGKAIGFMFIPFFNLYWQFVAWPRFVQRLNFQFRLRGRPSPVSDGLVTTTLILNLVSGLIIVTFPVVVVLSSILVGQSQSAVNTLAAERGA
jgi:Protein of unknown function (DUF2510)